MDSNDEDRTPSTGPGYAYAVGPTIDFWNSQPPPRNSEEREDAIYEWRQMIRRLNGKPPLPQNRIQNQMEK